MRFGRLSTMTAILCAAAVLATACGRRGNLDSPYEAAVDARREAEQDKVKPLPPEPAKPVKDRPFFLDRLIQ
jgi:hypothetical protein